MPKKKKKQIKKARTSYANGMSFSFQYFQNNHPKFSIRDRNSRYLSKFLERLQNLSRLSIQEILRDRSSSLRCHPIV